METKFIPPFSSQNRKISPTPVAFDHIQELGPAQSVYLGNAHLIPGVIACGLVSILFAMLSGALASDYQQTENGMSILIPAGILAAVALSMGGLALFLLGRLITAPRAAVVYRDGLAYRDWRGLHTWRWEEITAIYSNVQLIVSRRKRFFRYSYRIQPRQGQSVTFDYNIDYVGDLGKAVKSQVYPRLLPALQQRYHNGERLVFGPLAVSRRDGLAWGNKHIAWNDVLKLDATLTHLEIARRDSSLLSGRYAVRLEKIPNVELLCSLLEIQAPQS